CVAHPIADCCNADAECLDQDACNGVERCVAHACVAGVAPDCDDHNVCTDDRCDATAGCVHVDNIASCDDGNACTQGDTCHDGTCTAGAPIVCAAADQCHAVGTCNPATGVCANPPKANGTICSDGNACTQTDTCQNGTCTGGNAVVCTAAD